MQETLTGASVVMKAMTAEVQTIVMNNRQVTLSVARQLDQVHLSMMEPWGRVSLLRGRSDENQMAIGVSDGQLVIAEIPDENATRERALCYDFPEGVFVEVCPSVNRKYDAFGGVDIYVDDAILRTSSRKMDTHDCYEFTSDTHQEFRVSCAKTHLDLLLRIAIYKQQRDKDLRLIQQSNSLPKIVLAGLK